MPRDEQPIDIDEYGAEVHPSFGVAVINVTHSTGSYLFDSEIAHHEFVTLKVQAASRKRDLHRDWIHGIGPTLVEIHLSKAQWADLISSFGNGGGVPVTIDVVNGRSMPDAPHSSRLGESQNEVRRAGEVALADITRAFEEWRAKPNKSTLTHLEAMIRNGPANMAFAAKSLTEHTEKVVTKARADLEAMLRVAAENRELGAAESPPELNR